MKPFLREFPFAPRPKSGQSFSSYIETVAAEHVPPLDIITLLYEIGVIEEDRCSSLPYGYGVVLTDQQVRNIAFTLRLTEERIREMLVSHYNGIAIDISEVSVADHRSIRQAAQKNASFVSTRICPLCLGESPYFQLAHRLPWLFLCSKHKTLLSQTCPRCTKPYGNFSPSRGGMPAYATGIPNPALCRNPLAEVDHTGRKGPSPCGQPLAGVFAHDVSRHRRVLNAQMRIERVLECREAWVWGQRLESLEYFEHLHSLIALLDYGADLENLGSDLPLIAIEAAKKHIAERDNFNGEKDTRRRRSAPTRRTPEWMCAFLPTAVELLDLPTEQEFAERFSLLISQARRFRSGHFRQLAQHFKFQGPILQIFNATLLPTAGYRRRKGYSSPFSHHLGQPYTYQPDHVPQLFWEETFKGKFADLFVGVKSGERHIRSFISLDLVRLCGDSRLPDAAWELGFERRQTTAVADATGRTLLSLGRYDTYLIRLHETAAKLESNNRPFNFGRRRRHYANLTELFVDNWQNKLWARDLNHGKWGSKHIWAATYVWALLTGGHPRRAPIFQSLSCIEYNKAVVNFSSFSRNHLQRLWPAIRTIASTLNYGHVLAGEVSLEACEDWYEDDHILRT